MPNVSKKLNKRQLIVDLRYLYDHIVTPRNERNSAVASFERLIKFIDLKAKRNEPDNNNHNIRYTDPVTIDRIHLSNAEVPTDTRI